MSNCNSVDYILNTIWQLGLLAAVTYLVSKFVPMCVFLYKLQTGGIRIFKFPKNETVNCKDVLDRYEDSDSEYILSRQQFNNNS